MPSKKTASHRPAPKGKAKARPAPAKAPAKKTAPAAKPKTPAKPAPKPSGKKSPASSADDTIAIPLRGDGRRHMLSLSFLRDGDEFLARLETDVGQITELKNRSLDQLLTLVAGELEDLLE